MGRSHVRPRKSNSISWVSLSKLITFLMLFRTSWHKDGFISTGSKLYAPNLAQIQQHPTLILFPPNNPEVYFQVSVLFASSCTRYSITISCRLKRGLCNKVKGAVLCLKLTMFSASSINLISRLFLTLSRRIPKWNSSSLTGYLPEIH